jgi:hypothetical protein
VDGAGEPFFLFSTEFFFFPQRRMTWIVSLAEKRKKGLDSIQEQQRAPVRALFVIVSYLEIKEPAG